MIKRLMDITLALALLVILAPVSLAIAAILWLTQRRIIFKQKRVGRYGWPFTIYKFVTMRPGSGQHIAINNKDARMTRIGRFLRATALDEIPELVNVVKGDMSIVGPRPAQVWEHEQCAAEIHGWRERLLVKPGLIGLAQLKAHRCDNFAKLTWDSHYIATQSLWLDLKLIAMGIICNLKGRWV